MRHYWLTSDSPDLPVGAFRRARGLNRPDTLEGIGGGKGGGSAPSYPDPQTVANAVTGTNQQTAAYNKALNLNNYSNPFGSQQSHQVGTDPNTGAPIYNTTVSANPQLQGALNNLLGQTGNSSSTNSYAQQGLGDLTGYLSNIGYNAEGIGNRFSGLSSNVSGLAGQLSPQAAQQAQQQGQNAAYASQTQYLDPQFSQQKESLDAQLANQGITPGSEAYNNAVLNYNNQKQQAYSNAQNQSILTGNQIGTQNLNNQINSLNAQAGLYGQAGGLLQSQLGAMGVDASTIGQRAGIYGQQVGIGQTPYSNLSSIAGLIPGYSGTAQSSSSPADLASLYNNQYQSQLAGYNAGQSSTNGLQSGLFGLGSSALMGYMMSDRRAKRSIRRVATFPNGLGVYTYHYIGEARNVRHLGFMADEVRAIAPHAVLRGADGFDRVNYVLAVR